MTQDGWGLGLGLDFITPYLLQILDGAGILLPFSSQFICGAGTYFTVIFLVALNLLQVDIFAMLSPSFKSSLA